MIPKLGLIYQKRRAIREMEFELKQWMQRGMLLAQSEKLHLEPARTKERISRIQVACERIKKEIVQYQEDLRQLEM